MTRLLFVFSAVLFWVDSSVAKPVVWNLDKAHTRIGFSVRHLGITNVKGKFTEFEANITADESSGKLVSVEATAKSASVDTGITKRDNHLRSDDFFNAAKFPVLKLKTKKLKWKENKLSGAIEITIRGITKTVPFEGELLGVQKVNFGDGDQLRAGYEGKVKINRQEFGLRFNALAEGVSIVSDQVTIEIAVEVSRKI